jgi:hypothetical protein
MSLLAAERIFYVHIMVILCKQIASLLLYSCLIFLKFQVLKQSSIYFWSSDVIVEPHAYINMRQLNPAFQCPLPSIQNRWKIWVCTAMEMRGKDMYNSIYDSFSYHFTSIHQIICNQLLTMRFNLHLPSTHKSVFMLFCWHGMV